MPLRRCRSCDASLDHEMVDLGAQPLANAFLRDADLDRMEPTWPLRAWVCGACLLVQLEAFEAPERIFSDYPYFSSVSPSWLEHARRFAELVIDRLGLGAGSRVIEIASNDGYLLQYFAGAGVSVLGVEPAANVARLAAARGIPTRIEFFGAACADRLVGEGVRADLLVANNVLAHVPDLHDFVEGLRRALAPGGVLCAEFPHLLRLLQENQFDTIYHEHFSYLSLLSLEPVLEGHGLRIFDVEELPTHGGSLRIHAARDGRAVSPRVEALRRLEHEAGLHRLDVYTGFGAHVRQVKRRLLEMLIGLKSRGASVVGYGAPAKGNTLLNYCGIGRDFLDYVVDRSPAKQGLYLPGTRLAVHPPERVRETKPDYLLVLPWNLQAEVVEQMSFIREWGGRFIVPIPEPKMQP